MWIGLNDGWLSIVKNNYDEETLLVRARTLEHLTNVFPDCDYFKDSSADYPYRAYINRTIVADVIANRLMKIDYPNFKNSVEDDKLHNVYSRLWNELYFSFLNER